MLCKILVVMGTCIVVVSRVMYYMSCFERLSTRVLCLICCGNLYCRRVVLIIAMLYLVSFCELFLKALFTCVFQVELIKVSTLRGPCFACNRHSLLNKSRSMMALTWACEGWAIK